VAPIPAVPPSPPAQSCPPIRGLVRLAGAALLVALTAMVAVHLLQPRFDFTHQPLSYHVHGRGGWLLSVALAAFGGAVVVLARAVRVRPDVAVHPITAGSLRWSGFGLVAAAVFPSDRWFPWEQAPSVAGLIHAGAGVVAPAVLLMAVVAVQRLSRALRLAGISYTVLILVCGALLAVGWFNDGPPPAIGAAERLLGGVALAWAFLLWRALARVAARPAPVPAGAAVARASERCD
jgi:hypothetical membrane protein